jgi:C4-type Zn-finger protein
MSTNCAACGYRDNEVKSGGEVSAKGKRITLKVEDVEDLSRDILKVSHPLSLFNTWLHANGRSI